MPLVPRVRVSGFISVCLYLEVDKMAVLLAPREQRYGGCYFQLVLISIENQPMTDFEINVLQGSCVLLYSKA